MGNDHFRSRELLDLAYQLPCTLRLPCCVGGVCQPCHSNQARHGKGGALKAHDCFWAAGCWACHRELDQGRTMSREEKFAVWDRAYLETQLLLWQRKLIRVS